MPMNARQSAAAPPLRPRRAFLVLPVMVENGCVFLMQMRKFWFAASLLILPLCPPSAVPAAGEGQGLHPAARRRGADHLARARFGRFHPGVGGIRHRPRRCVHRPFNQNGRKERFFCTFEVKFSLLLSLDSLHQRTDGRNRW